MARSVRNWSALENPVVRHDMQIGGHTRSEGLIVFTNNMREFNRTPGSEPRIGSTQPDLNSAQAALIR